MYKELYLDSKPDPLQYMRMFESILGYAFGSSSITMLSRIGGGIYMKAADVGSDLVGKIIVGLDEDSPLNPGMIADNVGDNVGGIAGMTSDVFSCVSELLCAALIICSLSNQLVVNTNSFYYFPFMILCTGLLASIFISICGFSIF